jgi:hypothetical protein
VAKLKEDVKRQMPYKFDLADVKGQLRPRRALEIAAAGGHSLLFKGLYKAFGLRSLQVQSKIVILCPRNDHKLLLNGSLDM